MTLTLFPVLYDGLNTRWLTPQDIDPDLAAIQVWVRFAEPCRRHPDGLKAASRAAAGLR